VLSEVPTALKQGLAHELVNVKLIVFSDVKGAIGASLEACVSLIRMKVTASQFAHTVSTVDGSWRRPPSLSLSRSCYSSALRLLLFYCILPSTILAVF
jgi:hypothetical protein